MPKPRKQGRPKSKEPIGTNNNQVATNYDRCLRELAEESYNPMSMHIRQAIAEYLRRKNGY